MCADHTHVSDGVLLLSGLLQRNRAILAWRCAGYERGSNLFDLKNGDEGLCPYIKRNGETPVEE